MEYEVTTVMSSVIELSDLNPDNGNGTNSPASKNFFKTLGSRLKTNPADDKHLFVIQDMVQLSAQERMSTLFEVKDITTATSIGAGGHPFATVGGNSTTLGFSASSGLQAGQTFTPNSFTGGFDLHNAEITIAKVGSPVGNLKCELRATAAGLPTTLIATSETIIDGSEVIASTSGTYSKLSFNFSTPITLDGATQYAIVVLADGHIPDSTNYWTIQRSNTSAGTHPGGDIVNFDGTIWTTTANTDIIFQLRDFWVDIVGLGQSVEFNIQNLYDVESGMEIIDSNSMKLLFRRTFAGAGSDRAHQGHPFERTLTVSNTSVKSIITNETCSSYNENGSIPDFDRNIVLNVACGSDSARTRDLITGVLSVNPGVQDRGIGLNQAASSTLTEVIDTDFQEDIALDFNGSSSYIGYANHEFNNVNTNQKFIIEIEAKRDVDGVLHTLCSKGPTSGWHFYISASNKLTFDGSSFTATQSTESFIGTGLRKYRVTGDGDKLQLFSSEGAALTAGPNGSSVFTEVTYGGQQTGGYTFGSTTNQFQVGRRADTANQWWNGQIGYVKMALNTTSFAYDGYKSHPQVVSVQSVGANLMLGKQGSGENDGANNYYDAGVSKDGAPLVDSYDIFIKCAKTFATAGKQAALKTTMRRGDEAIQSSEQGRMFTFLK